MSDQFRQLQRLRVELHEVNQEWTRAGVRDLAAHVLPPGICAGSPPGNETLPDAREDEETRHLPPLLMPPEWHSCPRGGAARRHDRRSSRVSQPQVPRGPVVVEFAYGVRGFGTIIALDNQNNAKVVADASRDARLFPADGSSKGFAMLRITTDEDPRAFTLRLEGRLEGPWVEVLTECWHGAGRVGK